MSDIQIPDHYALYRCNDCGQELWSPPRVEESDLGVWCLECGSDSVEGIDHE